MKYEFSGTILDPRASVDERLPCIMLSSPDEHNWMAFFFSDKKRKDTEDFILKQAMEALEELEEEGEPF